MADQRDGVLVPEHFVPTPTTVSAEAQAFLRMKPPFTGRAMPGVDDVAGWKALREATEAGLTRMTRACAARYPAKTVTHELSDSRLYEITPDNVASENGDSALYYIHGGGFSSGGGESCINLGMQLAGLAQCKTYSIDYRLAPEFPFPGPLDDTLEGYRFILNRHEPQQVAIFGISAGANLAAAVTLKMRDLGVAMPAALAMHSCFSDLSTFGDSGYTNDTVDIMIPHIIPELSVNYARNKDLENPYLSPVFGDFSKGFPPTILSSGTRDLVLSGTVRLHRAMVRAGAKAELHIWEAMPHFPFIGAPEERELYNTHIKFIFDHLKR